MHVEGSDMTNIFIFIFIRYNSEFYQLLKRRQTGMRVPYGLACMKQVQFLYPVCAFFPYFVTTSAWKDTKEPQKTPKNSKRHPEQMGKEQGKCESRAIQMYYCFFKAFKTQYIDTSGLFKQCLLL